MMLHTSLYPSGMQAENARPGTVPFLGCLSALFVVMVTVLSPSTSELRVPPGAHVERAELPVGALQQQPVRRAPGHAHDWARAARLQVHDLLADLHAVRAPHRQLWTLASAQVRGAAQRARKAGAAPVVHGTDLGGAEDP